MNVKVKLHNFDLTDQQSVEELAKTLSVGFCIVPIQFVFTEDSKEKLKALIKSRNIRNLVCLIIEEHLNFEKPEKQKNIILNF